ncbi:nucleoside deaminase [Virgibacillus ihumii]|uniref:nucleoside deaminase n=1 Tax=Virgibacillus ihumii TaxID=2686091 RepID=UPI00157C4781|nr:nucleoside deaminase [Virgibacillus ihumii]
MDKFMQRAVELAAKNVQDGGQPFGAVLVKNNKLVTEGVNELHKHFDVSGHAEMLAIRRAQKKMHTPVLQGYTMYASGEPCPMCLTAMQFAGITEVYYCATVDDAQDAGLGKSKEIYEDLKKPNEERTFKLIHMPLEDRQDNPMKMWQEKN